MTANKKFVSIVWNYFEHMKDMAPEESYHIHVLKMAKVCGYKPYMILKGGSEHAKSDPNFDKDIEIIEYKNIFQFLFEVIKFSFQNTVFYVNSYEWQSFLIPFLANKTIFMAHTQPKRQTAKRQMIQNFVYRFFTKIRLNNEEEKKFLLEQGTPENKLEVVPLIVSQKVFHNTENQDRKDLVYFGNITAKKDLITILKAFQEVKKIKPETKIHIIGNMWDTEVPEFIKNSHYKNDIIVHGFLPNDELVKLLNECLIYVNSSLDEGQCVAVYDAALCGLGLCLPSIMSFVGVFKDKALFHDVRDYKKLSENILQYIDNPEMIKSHVQKNAEMITQDYSIETVEDKLKKLISNI